LDFGLGSLEWNPKSEFQNPKSVPCPCVSVVQS
jgi:hypothetical protein